MKKIFFVVSQWVCVLFIVSCSLVPESIAVKPVVTVPQSNLGAGKKVLIQVVDGRVHKRFGVRVTAIQGLGASILLGDDLIPSLQESVSKGLSSYQFEPVLYSPNKTSQRRFKLTLEDFRYSQISAPFNLKVVLDCVMKVQIENNGKKYEQVFRVQDTHSIQITPTSSDDQQYINEVLSRNLTKILTDNKLLSVLSS